MSSGDDRYPDDYRHLGDATSFQLVALRAVAWHVNDALAEDFAEVFAKGFAHGFAKSFAKGFAGGIYIYICIKKYKIYKIYKT